jgi:hypothetical protein
MREVSEEKGFVKKDDNQKIRPQLSHENRNEIAEAYVQEDVLLVERKSTQKRKKIIAPENTDKVLQQFHLPLKKRL